MKELISIIVPVYNTEAYLQECIQSVLKQTYRHWELLLVDDGSTDKSGEICESYAADDNRIKVFHQNNAGQSKARNTALEFCEGKYYTFLDSDDRLSEDALEILYTSMRNTDSDISCGGGFSFGNRTRKAVCMPDGKYVLNAEEACRRMFIQDGLNSNTVAKLYRAHLWNQVKFPENHIFEDVPIMYKIVLNSNQVSFCDRYVYEQRSRAGSTTRKDWSDERKIYVTYSQAVYEDIKQRLPQMAEEAFVYYLTAVIDNYIHVSLSRNNKDYREYREELYRTIKENDAIMRKYPCLRRMRKRIIVCKLGLGGGTKRYLFKTKIGKRKRRYNMDIKGKVKNRGGYIAVIIAAYNAEAYIERCIRSVQNQTYGNWKVYVVDDGSTDNTLKILERIVRNEERVCAVHTENNGVFAARRTAIDLVENCEYLTFLDSDDFFCENELFACCVDEVTEHKLDYLGFNYRTEQKSVFRADEKVRWINKKELLKDLLTGIHIDGNMQFSLYRTNIVKKYFKVYSYNNDDFFNKYDIIMHAGRCAYIPITGYFYSSNPGSQTRLTVQEKDSLYYKHSLEFIKTVLEQFPELIEECEYFSNNILLWLAAQLAKEKETKQLKIYEFIMREFRSHGKIFLTNPYFDKRKKLRFLVIYFHLYGILFYLYSKYMNMKQDKKTLMAAG